MIHEWWGNHSVWITYSEKTGERGRERRWGPALRILLIRFPNPRSHCPAHMVAKSSGFGHTVNTLISGWGIPRGRCFSDVPPSNAAIRRPNAAEGRVGATCHITSAGCAALAHFQAVLLRRRGDDAVQAQVINDLTIVIGDVPHGDDREAQLGVWSAVAAFNAVHRILRVDGGQDF